MIEETILMQIDEADTLTADLSRSYIATTNTDGFISKEDKAKLDTIQAGAEKNKVNKISIFGEEIEPDPEGNVDLSVPIIKFFE